MSVRDRDGEVAERVRRGQGASESADVEPSVGRSRHESSLALGAAGTTAGVGRKRATVVSATCDGRARPPCAWVSASGRECCR
jgi:hypothetical protein